MEKPPSLSVQGKVRSKSNDESLCKIQESESTNLGAESSYQIFGRHNNVVYTKAPMSGQTINDNFKSLDDVKQMLGKNFQK